MDDSSKVNMDVSSVFIHHDGMQTLLDVITRRCGEGKAWFAMLFNNEVIVLLDLQARRTTDTPQTMEASTTQTLEASTTLSNTELEPDDDDHAILRVIGSKAEMLRKLIQERPAEYLKRVALRVVRMADLPVRETTDDDMLDLGSLVGRNLNLGVTQLLKIRSSNYVFRRLDRPMVIDIDTRFASMASIKQRWSVDEYGALLFAWPASLVLVRITGKPSCGNDGIDGNYDNDGIHSIDGIDGIDTNNIRNTGGPAAAAGRCKHRIQDQPRPAGAPRRLQKKKKNVVNDDDDEAEPIDIGLSPMYNTYARSYEPLGDGNAVLGRFQHNTDRARAPKQPRLSSHGQRDDLTLLDAWRLADEISMQVRRLAQSAASRRQGIARDMLGSLRDFLRFAADAVER